MLLPEFGQLPFVKPADGHTCDTYTTFSWFFHAGKLIEQGGFTGSVGADDTEKAAFLHLETYIFQCFMLRLAIFKTKIFYIYYYSTHHVTAFK